MLPVEPPEIDTLFLERAQEVVCECLIETFVFELPRNDFRGVGIETHIVRHASENVFRSIHAHGWMEVECEMQSVVVDVFEQFCRVGNQVVVPAPTGPSAASVGFVGIRVAVPMPIHVENQDIGIDVILFKVFDDVAVIVGSIVFIFAA